MAHYRRVVVGGDGGNRGRHGDYGNRPRRNLGARGGIRAGIGLVLDDDSDDNDIGDDGAEQRHFQRDGNRDHRRGRGERGGIRGRGAAGQGPGGREAGRGFPGREDMEQGRGRGERRGAGRGERGRGRGGRGGGGLRHFGYQQLRDLATKEPGELVLTLSHPNSGFRDALFQSANKMDMVKLLLRVLAQAVKCQSQPASLLNIFTLIKEASFFDTVILYFLQMQSNPLRQSQEETYQAIKDIIQVLNELIIQMPNSVTQFIGVHDVLRSLIDSLRSTTDVIDEDVLTMFSELTEAKERVFQRFQRNNLPTGKGNLTRMEDKPPPEDFRDIEIFPQTADLQIEEGGPYLRKNLAKGAYEDLNHYLDVQFRLMREDFVGPLRDGIASYIQAIQERGRNKKRIQEVRIYPNVRIIAPVCSDTGLCHVLQFDISRMGKVRWANSKRLIFGSLVCLSADNFKTFYFATVANREVKDLEKGLIQVQFELNQGRVRELMGETFTMAETTAYFESYRHVLSGLKNTREGGLPFEQYIIQCNSEVGPPQYIQRRPETKFDLRPLVDEDIVLQADSRLEEIGRVVEARQQYTFSVQSDSAQSVALLERWTWPPEDLLHLDASQYRAIHTALTKEFAIIQGPPGTGKTYLGLKIVKALLHNRKSWSFHPDTGHEDLRPMLIVCYTNHALDQFLEGINKFFKGDLLRVGGRSNSEALKNFNIHNFRQRFRHAQKIPIAIFQGRREAKEEMELLRRQIDTNGGKIQIARTNVLHEDFLQHVMGQWYYKLTQQFDEFLRAYGLSRCDLGRKHSVIVEWLGFGNLAELVQEEARLPQEIEPEPAEDGEDFIDVEDEIDAIQAQRRLEIDADDELEFEMASDVLDDLETLAIAPTRRERENIMTQLEMTRTRERAVALGVEDVDKAARSADGQGWEQTKRQKKKLKKKMLYELSSGNNMSEQEARRVQDLWRLDQEEKWRLYRMWVNSYCQQLMNEIHEKEAEFAQAAQRYKEAAMQEDREIMRQATVIGMTTTGAARYQAILQEIQPRIIVVEEAAEVLEAHIITTLNRGCEHLILIGDHKQLKPNPTVYQLATKYNLEISLFERMINNGIRCDCLELQHRMRPEIAELMKPIYKNLKNHPEVFAYDNIKGVVENVFFVDHREPEQDDQDLRSHSNLHEAEYIAGLCNFLLLQGYEPSQITVLTTYSGQLFCLRRMMPKSRYEGVRVTVVDNYQGEENDIILLSLVRSNPDGIAGFLKTDNRVCVALSRAKKGFYVIGNFELLAGSSKLWREITIQMTRKNRMGEALALSCQNHPDDPSTLIKMPRDFDMVPEGGCKKKCDARLKCGHTCEMFCHVLDKNHLEYQCRKSCEKKICPNGHKCPKRCFEECGNCHVPTPKTIRRCGHEQMVPCHMNPDKFVCKERCSSVLSCGHACQSACGEAHTRECAEKITFEWECGHIAKIRCGNRDKTVCPKKCQAVLECGHICKGTCGSCFQGRLHVPCQSDCRRPLVCGHECQDNCNSCPPCRRPCQNRCKHSRCLKKCGEECAPCTEPCAWRCEHYKCDMLCSEPCNRPRCNEPCTKRLDCNHQCIGLCGEPCPNLCRLCNKEEVTQIFFGDEDEPDARFVLLEDCRHVIESEAMDKFIDDMAVGEGSIQFKTCPRCKTPIRKITRYGTVINRTLVEIERVKRKVIGNEDRIKQLRRDLDRSIHAIPAVTDRLIMMRRFKEIDRRPSENAMLTLQNQISFINALNKVESEYKNLKSGAYVSDKQRNLSYIERFKKWVKTSRTILTDQEITDAKMEMSRLEYHLKLMLYMQNIEKTKPDMSDELKREVRHIENLFRDDGRFTDERKKRVKSCIAELEKVRPLSGLGVSDEERVMIVQAMALTKGHWFSCPNGHVYAIGDCGGATMEGQCPECKATIGGAQHRLRSDNRLAPEMDGARHAAWSDAVNLENYLLNIND